MIGASKILTVSYGTFSCTLEGFEEPFNTMKAIAEYFRDLAADDRYFGAEPPVPDAAMLHRIAEREIQRRVEAKIDGNGVVLRAEDLGTPRVTMPNTYGPNTYAPSVASAADAAPAIESAAARLSRLRAAQNQFAPAPIAARFADLQAYAEDQDAEIIATVVAAPVAEPTPIAPPFVATPVVEAAAAPVEAAADVSDTLRETLAGLIDQNDQIAAEPEVPVVDLAPEVFFDDTPPEAYADPEDDASAADLADLYTLDGEPAPLPEPVASDLPDPVAEAPAEIAAPAEIDPTPEPAEAFAPAPEPAIPEPAAPVVVTEKLQRARARVIKIRRLDTMGAPAAVLPAEAPLSVEAEAALQRELAALEAEIAPATPVAASAPMVAEPADDLPAYLADDLAANLADDLPEGLAAALADPLPDAPDALAAAVADAIAIAIAEPVAEPVAEVHKLPDSDDAAVSRILAQTNSALEVPEVKRRRSAIAHLKAAVLATVAERRINPNATKRDAEVKMDPYRKDLDQVVGPVPTPAPDRPAPLVLVSAQRIDRKINLPGDPVRPVPQVVVQNPAPAPVLPVRPRRVTAGGQAAQAVSAHLDDDEDGALSPEDMANIFADGSKQSFSEFAETLGAASMAELIEAAGAYCTLILDRPSFTRPLLFQQIATLPKLAELNREDSLRGFGKLLRDGRIQKTRRGQYALADTSPILSEAKRIAG